MNFIHSNGMLGFVYRYECIDKDGNVKWTMREENLIPDVGRDYFLNAGLNGGTQYSTWYIGLYEANRTPVSADTMTSLIADCQESTSYTTTGNARLTLNDDALSAGVWSNVGSPAEFTFTASKTIYGGFVSSNATRSSTSGLLLSAVKNSSPKTIETGEILRVTAGLSLITA